MSNNKGMMGVPASACGGEWGRGGPRGRRGFALIAALALMAFLVLLIVSLSGLARVETGAAHAARQTALARHHALFALDLALAELALRLGDDRAVSARADIAEGVARGSGGALWTGAWGVLPEGERGRVDGPVWLVSGVSADPRSVPPPPQHGRAGAGAESILLRSPRGDLGPVVVPLVPLRAAEDAFGETVAHGRYAYWVGDENVKARVLPEREAAELGLAEANSRAALLRREVYAGAFADFHDAGAPWRAEFASVRVPAQTRFLEGFDADGFRASADDFTVHAHGLPTDTVRGGWRGVIRPDALETLPAPFAEASRYLDYERNFGSLPTGHAPALLAFAHEEAFSEGSAVGDASAGFHPVLTEVVAKCGVFLNQDAPAHMVYVRVRFHLEFELTNPHAFPLDLTPPGGGARPYDIVLTGLPVVRVVNVTRDRELAEIDLNAARDGSNPPRIVPIHTWVDLRRLRRGGRIILEPGETIRVREPAQPQGLVRSDALGRRLASVDEYGEPGDWIEVSLAFPPDHAGTTFKLVPHADEAEPAERNVLSAVTGVPFVNDSFQLEAVGKPFFIGLSGDYQEEDYSFGFHFKLYDEPGTAEGLADFSRTFDLRRRVMDFSEHPRRFDMVSPQPGRVAIEDTFFSSLDGFYNTIPVSAMDGSAGRVRTDRDTRLYDVPETGLWTLGTLRHVPMTDHPPYSLGEPWGGALNAMFDSHLVEPSEDVAWLREVEALDPADPGLRVRGAFNINSTSETAWGAVLAMGLREYAVNRRGESPWTVSAEAAFFRHPFGAGMLRGVSTGLPPVAERYAEGVRLFAAGDLAPLAEAIVEGIRREGPFPSLAAFLESGVIAEAIAAGGLNDGLPEASPAWLRQGDVVEALAPLLAARSDTFVVRTYGDVLNPVTGRVEGRAACEAVVRRTGRVAADAPSAHARQWDVVFFRWLEWNGGWSE